MLLRCCCETRLHTELTSEVTSTHLHTAARTAALQVTRETALPREQNGLSEDDARYVFQQLVVSVDYQLRIGAPSRSGICCSAPALVLSRTLVASLRQFSNSMQPWTAL